MQNRNRHDQRQEPETMRPRSSAVPTIAPMISQRWQVPSTTTMAITTLVITAMTLTTMATACHPPRAPLHFGPHHLMTNLAQPQQLSLHSSPTTAQLSTSHRSPPTTTQLSTSHRSSGPSPSWNSTNLRTRCWSPSKRSWASPSRRCTTAFTTDPSWGPASPASSER